MQIARLLSIGTILWGLAFRTACANCAPPAPYTLDGIWAFYGGQGLVFSNDQLLVVGDLLGVEGIYDYQQCGQELRLSDEDGPVAILSFEVKNGRVIFDRRADAPYWRSEKDKSRSNLPNP